MKNTFKHKTTSEQDTILHVKKYSSFEKKKFLFVYLMIAFPVLQFLVFWVFVNISSICLAFQTPNGNFTFDNFKEVFRAFTSVDRYGFNLWHSITNSWKIWIVGEIILFPLSLLTSYVLYKKIWGHYIFRVCYIIPSLMGAVMFTTLLKYMVSDTGLITSIVKKIGIMGPIKYELPIQAIRNGLLGSDKTAFKTIMGIRIVMGLIGNNAVLTGAYSRIPDELYEAAEMDGAGFWTVFANVAVPCIWPTVCTLLTFSLCSFMTADYNVFLFTNGTGAYGTSTVGFLLYNITYTISLNGATSSSYGYPAALGLFLTLVTLPVVLIGKKVLENASENVQI